LREGKTEHKFTSRGKLSITKVPRARI
jgi:hypothetical protein